MTLVGMRKSKEAPGTNESEGQWGKSREVTGRYQHHRVS